MHDTPPHGQQAGLRERARLLPHSTACTLHIVGSFSPLGPSGGEVPGVRGSPADNLLSDAIGCTHKRCAIRCSNPTPTFNHLWRARNWRDEERLERTVDEARLAAITPRLWMGEKGMYSKLFLGVWKGSAR
jgi:hypothetical protein